MQKCECLCLCRGGGEEGRGRQKKKEKKRREKKERVKRFKSKIYKEGDEGEEWWSGGEWGDTRRRQGGKQKGKQEG